MRHSLIASLFLASLFLSGCSKEEENYDNAITFLNSNPIITEAIFSEEFNYSFSVNAVGDFQIIQNFNNCSYQSVDARIWLNIFGSNFKPNFKDIYSIKEDVFTGMDVTSYRLILNFAPITVGSLCANGCEDQYECSQALPSFTNTLPATTVYTQQYLIFNDEETRANYKSQFELLRDSF